ncbi:MAG: redoxin family protein, partial [Pirellulaceae bacterium]|nr:redoxin family protein [Pirellulaceae bacterium]
DAINAVTVSCDLPFAQGRFCGEHNINMQTASDYQDRNFGNHWGMLIEELKLHARGVFVLNSEGNLVYVETVGEVTEHPDYDAAISALDSLLAST